MTKIAGAYWKGSEKNPMLTRIYAVAFETLDELKNYLKIKKKRKKETTANWEKIWDFLFFPIWSAPAFLYIRSKAPLSEK